MTTDEFKLIKNAGNGCNESFEKILSLYKRDIECYARKYRKTGCCPQELVHVGGIGLLDACRKVDRINEGVQFITYAKFYIHKRMAELIDSSYHIYLPEDARLYLPRYYREKSRLGNKATFDDIVKNFKIDKYQKESLRHAVLISCKSLSVVDNVPNKHDDHPQDNTIPKIVFECLNEKEREVVILRCGLDGGEPRSVALLQDILGIPQQTISYRYSCAIKKLKKVFS